MKFIVMKEYLFSGTEPRFDYVGKFATAEDARRFIINEVKSSKGYYKLANFSIYKKENE